jgi:hypothetical protein
VDTVIALVEIPLFIYFRTNFDVNARKVSRNVVG